jgi:hypothetical protein
VSGKTIVVGACGEDKCVNGFDGGAFVFTRPKSGWKNLTQTAKLTAAGAADARLGTSVAIEGDTIVAGAPTDTVGANAAQGRVYVYTKPASGWTSTSHPTAALSAANGKADDRLGAAVAIDTDTIIAGAPDRTVNSLANHGAAYLFTKPAGGWQSATAANAMLFDNNPGPEGGFGSAVDINGDVAVVGAPYESDVQAGGLAFVFVKPVAGWKSAHQTRELEATDLSSTDSFGAAVGISGDTVIVGAPYHGATGAGYVFTRPQVGWGNSSEDPVAESAELTATTADDIGVGVSVAVEPGLILLGDPIRTTNGHQFAGSTYYYVEPAGGWATATEGGELSASDGGTNDAFGNAVGVDGLTIVVGATGHNAFGGAAYVFAPAAPHLSKLKAVHAPKGKAAISYKLDASATVTARFRHKHHGHYKTNGTATIHAGPGHSTSTINKLDNGKHLKSGKYKVTLSAKNAYGRSKEKSLTVKVR